MVGIALAIAAPAAHGAAFDVPYPPTSEHVKLTVTSKGEVKLRFGPKAAKLWRSIAGKPAQLNCLFLGARDGDFTVGGYGASTPRLPKRRGTVSFGFEGRADLCALSTRGHPDADGCLRLLAQGTWCVRVVAPITDAGRAYLDAFARTAELATVNTAIESGGLPDQPVLEALQQSVGAKIVALPDADAAPPPGSIGYFEQGTTSVISTVLADGRRRYVRRDADVYSTNDPRLPGNLEKLTFISMRGRF